MIKFLKKFRKVFFFLSVTKPHRYYHYILKSRDLFCEVAIDYKHNYYKIIEYIKFILYLIIIFNLLCIIYFYLDDIQKLF